MKLVYVLFACSIIFVSCKKAKIPVLTETYSREGIQFSYPKGWQVSSDETFQEGKTRTRLINLDMLNGEAIFQVIVLYSETDESFFLSTIDSMRGKKKEFFTRNNPETKVIEDGIEALNENLPKGIVLAAREKYTVDYKSGKFTYLNRFYFSQPKGASIFFTTQTSDTKDEDDEPIFRAILESFVVETKKNAGSA
ncbi:putative lipoprotein [Leptospira fainei serovar Hurstbridge str. BUT 6]|uniref:Lipoprotein n=1 Tax=Leptospira fainei serovar Hurstbridge str. BUT 6 TaxID=1193011 RepID=S3VYG4_9LEPT|nr:hypothetical protein [Leptospira fainei]EPG73167.1 putative lipoprotein [Leptospira fainei serovar Hurstbridge str. BUT 6]